MKRDLELVRSILFAIEDQHLDTAPPRISIANYSSEEIHYHVMIMMQAGLIYAYDFSSDEHTEWRPGYITWTGHEFLDSIREESVWRKAITLTKQNAGGVSFEILKIALTQYLKLHLSLGHN